jgi:signal transduction histidine kinase
MAVQMSTLPLELNPPTGAAKAPGEPPVDPLRADLIQILLVDDEPRNLTALESILDDPGYRLVRAESADEALLALITKEFALLILDIRMPGMTGFELAKLIRQRKKTEQLPIIFLTAYYNEDQHVLEGYGTGAVDYLHKPVNPVILRSKVAIFAELYRKSRALEYINRALVAEVHERRDAQLRLRELNETLEQRVLERTEALRASDEQKDRFIATLAHELRNPLGPIRYSVSLMQRNATLDPRFTQSLEVIDRQVSQMARLLDDLLDVSRITRSKLVLKTANVSVATLFERAVEIARPWIEKGGQVFNVEMPVKPISVSGDLTRLAQIVSNLLINAAKYTPAPGQIRLSVRESDGDVAIKVQDTGVGIDREQLPHIFEMFSQAPMAADGPHGGLGIGLALARGLSELHGGTLTGDSPGPGQGSEFVLSIPAIKEPSPVEASADTSAIVDGPPPRHKCRVVVVDDLRDSTDSLAGLVRSMGHDVQIAYEGEQGFQVVEQFRPHVALIDLGMPRVNGYELCRRIRAQPWGKSILVIAQTGWGQEFDRRRTQAAGFDHHLVKPLQSDVLEAFLNREATRHGTSRNPS